MRCVTSIATLRRESSARRHNVEGKLEIMDDKNGSDASWTPISKTTAAWTVRPNMVDYASTCATFSWDVARKEFLGAARPAGVNIADLAIDRHAEGLLADHVALRFVDRGGAAVQVRFRDAARDCCRNGALESRDSSLLFRHAHRHARGFAVAGAVQRTTAG